MISIYNKWADKLDELVEEIILSTGVQIKTLKDLEDILLPQIITEEKCDVNGAKIIFNNAVEISMS